jgi:hypothetical protein
MKTEQFVSIKQLKDALQKQMGLNVPVKITKKNGDTSTLFIRGFADPNTNILLISETFGSIGLNILEVKEIRTVHFSEHSNAVGSCILHAKGVMKMLMF